MKDQPHTEEALEEALEHEREELEEAIHVEKHNSINPVPEEYKDAKPLHQFWIWAGANIAPINWVLGALGIVLGLGLWDTVLTLAVGNLLGMLLFGSFVLMGQRTGVTQMVLSRSAFGRRGAYLPAFFQIVIPTGWIAINTWIILDLTTTLLKLIGIPDTTFTKVAVVLVIMSIQVGLATLGFYAIRTFEKWTVPVTLLILVAMSVVAWTSGSIDWNFAGKAQGAARWTAMSQVMTAIGIGWGIGWLPYASDYSRFVPRTTSRKRLFWASALGQFVPVLWLGLLGASIATTGTGVDPGLVIVKIFGALAIPVLLLVVHGPIATNILNVYSMSVAALAVDIKIPRHVLSLVVGIFATLFTVYLVFQGNLANNLDAWLGSVVAWVSPWASIMFIHYYIIRKENIDIEALYQPPNESRVGDVNWVAIATMLVGLFVTWMFLYGLVPLLQGPFARALHGLDLSWMAGFTVTGTLYYVLYRLGLVRVGGTSQNESGEGMEPASSTGEAARRRPQA
ncbi:MAG: cytosine permease [Rubrobacteraceae bacterium]|nr:cytosine permease [Rubrobacteraceae bacterium]